MRYILLALLLCGCGVSVPPLEQQEITSNLTKPAWPAAREGFQLDRQQRSTQHERLAADLG